MEKEGAMSTLTESCPYCGQPITRQQLDVIRARIRQEEQQKLNALAIEARKQIEEKYRCESEAQKQALKKQLDDALTRSNLQFAKERTTYQRKIQDLERQMEKKTANQLGDSQEVDLAQELSQAFREDVVRRVAKGDAGADVIQDVRYHGEVCGRIIYDSKNRRAWRNDFVPKLKEDKAQADAAHAVLVSRAFPRGDEEMCIEDGVIVVHPKRAVYIAQVLRASMIELHRQGLSLQERGTKMVALYRYMTSGDFRQRLREASELVGNLRQLDTLERDDHEKRWKTRERLHTRLKASTDDIDTQVTAIMEQGEVGSPSPNGA